MVGILHNVRSLHNVGSMFRSADAAGMSKLYLCGLTPTPLDEFGELRPQMTKVSLGAEQTVPWEKCTQITRVITRLKKEGYRIVAVEIARGATPYYKFTPPRNRKTALIVGHETQGLPKNVLRLADEIVCIPMFGKKESLNVSVAFGIVAMHCAVRGH